jgi:hypothetical protein
MRAFIIVMTFLLGLSGQLTAQDFLNGAVTFSHKKEAYLTLATGEDIVGVVSRVRTKKGLIKQIDLVLADGEKVSYLPEQVSYMYLAPSGFDKLSNDLDKVYTRTRWNEDHSAHAEHIKAGYVYFETTEVMIKKKKMTMLLQLVNPGFANGIKVYFDPFAVKSGGLQMSGVQVTGGEDKSFYFRKGDGIAERVKSKNYKEIFPVYFGDCEALETAYPGRKKWHEVEKHVFIYSEECN